MCRITDRDDWFDIWYDDRKCILDTMVRNMTDDLRAGYDYFGKSIRNERAEIEEYQKATNKALDQFKGMDEKEVNRWCYYELKKHGAIE